MRHLKYPEFPEDDVLQQIVNKTKRQYPVILSGGEVAHVWTVFGHRMPEAMRKPWHYGEREPFLGDTYLPSEVRSAMWAVRHKITGDRVAQKLAGV